MDYKKLAKSILDNVGGLDNVTGLTHCATRLRFTLKNGNIAKTEIIKETPGVVGVVNSGGQYQVIIGSDVGNVYRELNDLGSFVGETVKDENVKPLEKLLRTISGIFTPILPVITAAGMIKAVLSLLVVFKVVSTKDTNYQILNFIGDAAFYFLPVFLGGSAAKQFKANPYLGMLIGAIFIHPTLISLFAETKKAGTGLALFGIPFTNASYSSSVLPIILSVWFMSYVERFADKVTHKSVKFFIAPLITTLVTSIVALAVLGPIGAIAGQYLGDFFKWLNSVGSWIVPTVVGIFSPFLVMTGTHYGLVTVGINNRLTIGYDTVVQPGMLASNVSQGGAALAIALKTKNANKKALASSAGITAVCGITEPALYGVTLQNKAALIGTMVSGGVAGLFLGIFNAKNYAGGSPGLLTLPSYIGNNQLNDFYVAIAGLVIALIVSFIITFALYKEEKPVIKEEIKEKK